MSCCGGCATGVGCETETGGCSGGACALPGCAPWLGPATGCPPHAAGAQLFSGGATAPAFGAQVAPWLVSAGTGQLAALGIRSMPPAVFTPVGMTWPATPTPVPRPAPPASFDPVLWPESRYNAVVAVPGRLGLSLRAAPRASAAQLALLRNGTPVVVILRYGLNPIPEPPIGIQEQWVRVYVPHLNTHGYVLHNAANSYANIRFTEESSTGQLTSLFVNPRAVQVMPAPRADVFAPAAPPVRVQPAPPPIVTRQPLFRAVVAVPTGQPGLYIRSWPGLDAPIVGAAANGHIVEVYQIGIPQSDGTCPLCQWWHIKGSILGMPVGPIPVPQTGAIPMGPTVPGPVGFVRAIGPQGEWNLRRVG